jgi:mono/diheme cytochrome c family protein
MRASALALALAAAGCDTRETLVTPEPHLERMLDQKRADPYEANDFFRDKKTMQRPPEGTVPYEELPARSDLVLGVADGGFLAQIPIPVTRGLVDNGRHQYGVFCAPCHGTLGDGTGPVAFNMRLRKPPSLVDAPVTGYPPGQIYSTIAVGYGLMPSYATQLDVDDRWGVVAYVEALQVAHRSKVDNLPAAVRTALAKETAP